MRYSTQSLSHVADGWRGRKTVPPVVRRELPKVVVSRSTRDLIRRCTIHVVPIITTAIILTMNLHGIYIGQDFAGPIKSETLNLLLLQIAAKVHELMIQASLGAIVFNAVRYELLFGDGLPLGLIGSGLAFTQIEFFIRKEFYAAAKHWFNHHNTGKKAAFLVLLLVSGAIAMLAGPSSATLLVPKSQEWPSGGTDYFLDGGNEAFWPIDLSGELPELQSVCNSKNSASLAVCPAGGFLSLLEHWGRTNSSNFYKADVRSYAKRLSGSTFYWPVHSPSSLIPSRYLMGNARLDEEPTSSTSLTIPHTAPATILQQLVTDWWTVAAPDDDIHPSQIDDRQAHSTHLHAISTVRCSEPQNLSATATAVQFPSLQGRFDYAKPLDMNVSDLANARSSDHLRFRWLQLPDTFGALSVGGLFESAWYGNESRVVIGCSAQAGWVPAQATTDEYSFWTGWYPWNVTFGARVPFFNAVAPGQPIGKSNGRVAMGDIWLDLLTPPTSISPSTSEHADFSTIETIFEHAGLDGTVDALGQKTTTQTWSEAVDGNGTRARHIEAIICSVLADGLSRYGSQKVYNNVTSQDSLALAGYKRSVDFKSRILNGQNALEKPSIAADQFTTLRITMKISGFAFRPSLAGSLAMAVLIAHMLLAAAHIIWLAIFTKQTSGCWTLVTELVTLAFNSRSHNSYLENTGAGIEYGSTIGQVARIRARCHSDNSVEDRVELVFDCPPHDANGSGINMANIKSSNHVHGRGSIGKNSMSQSSGLNIAFDDRARTTSTDTLIALAHSSSDDHFETVQVGRTYS